MIILPSRNGMLLRNSNGILAADCGGDVCNGLPQYINASLSNVEISTLGYWYVDPVIWPFDTDPSTYNTNYTIPYDSKVNNACYYYLKIIGDANTPAENRTSCTTIYRTGFVNCYIYFYFNLKRISVRIGNLKSGYFGITVFSGQKDYSESEWNDMLSTKTTTLNNSLTISASAVTYCGKTAHVTPIQLGENGECVLSW